MVYFLTVVTGNRKNAGTDANIFVEIGGELGKTTTHQLQNNKKNKFERGEKDFFSVSCKYTQILH